jgi:hypothetical protein
MYRPALETIIHFSATSPGLFVLLQVFSKESRGILILLPSPILPPQDLVQPEISKMPLPCFKPGKNAVKESNLASSASTLAERGASAGRQDRQSEDARRKSGSDRVPELPTNAELSVRGQRRGQSRGASTSPGLFSHFLPVFFSTLWKRQQAMKEERERKNRQDLTLLNSEGNARIRH